MAAADAPMPELPEGWPTPDPTAAQHSLALCRELSRRIEAEGDLSFHDWMEAVLYTPGLGYYMAGAARFGAAGDFVTAPEISPLFGRTLAQQCRQILMDCDGDTILELGPGRGRLAFDILQEMDRADALPERYLLLDRSGPLRQEQEQTLAALSTEARARVQWLNELPERPVRGLILANEVLDALPVERFRRLDHDIEQLMVGLENRLFAPRWRPAPAALRTQVEALEADLDRRFEHGYVSECCPGTAPWIASLGDSLDRGVMLLIDYGYTRREYYHTDRRDGTFRCHYRHRAHDDWRLVPGLQDLTAYVDFTAVAIAAQQARLDILGFAPQAHFLMGAGITDLLASASALDNQDADSMRLAQQAKALMLPGEMGERFRVLALGRQFPTPIKAFRLYNHLEKL